MVAPSVAHNIVIMRVAQENACYTLVVNDACEAVRVELISFGNNKEAAMEVITVSRGHVFS